MAIEIMAAASNPRDLIEATGKGDTRAFRQLFTLYAPRVMRFLTRAVGNTAIAEEILNEVFLAAWQGARRYEGRSEPLTWLLSIAHNKAVSAMRKKREVSGVDDTLSHGFADESDTPEVTSQKLDKSQIIRTCINRLSEEHRIILDLVYYQERSIAEAAEILSIPENTVKTRMFYARKKLSEILKANGVDRGWP